MIFGISGTLPAPWEDFFGDDNKTNVTITGNAHKERIVIAKDGWVDIYVKDKTITHARAIDVLGAVVDGPISLIYCKNCQSI